MLKINGVKWEFDSFYGGDLRIDTKKYKIEDEKSVIELFYAPNSAKENHKDLALQQYVMLLLKQTYRTRVTYVTLPFERSDKHDEFAKMNTYTVEGVENILSETHTVNPYRKIKIPDIEGIYVFPDHGAVDRYDLSYIGGSKLLLWSKKRINGEITEQNTDWLTKEQLVHMHEPNIVIKDDVCSMGGTFIGIAKEIKELNPSVKLTLKVSKMEGLALEKHKAKETELFDIFDNVLWDYEI